VELHLELFVLLPLVLTLNTLVHELGHAITALLLTDARVSVHLGRGRPVLSWRGRRVSLVVHAAFCWTGWYVMSGAGELSVVRRVLILGGGPLASLGTCAVSGGAYLTMSADRWTPVVLAVGVGALAQFVSTALPLRYPRWVFGRPDVRSDGAQIMHALRQR
jgi:hypothetical protein